MPMHGGQPIEGSQPGNAPHQFAPNEAPAMSGTPGEASLFAENGDAPLFDPLPETKSSKPFAPNGTQAGSPSRSGLTPSSDEALAQPFGHEPQGETIRYIKGRDGKDGRDGLDGLDGKDGKDGKHGLNGKDGQDELNNEDDIAFDKDKDHDWEPSKAEPTMHHTVTHEPAFDWLKWLLIFLGAVLLVGLLAWLLRRLFARPMVPNTTNVNVGLSPMMTPGVNPYKDTQIGLQGRTALRAMPEPPAPRSPKKESVVDNPF